MDLKGFGIVTDNCLVEDTMDLSGVYASDLIYNKRLEIDGNEIVSILEIIYYSAKYPRLPIVTLKTTLTTHIDDANNIDVLNTEKVLYTFKTQLSYMFMVLYQKLASLNVNSISLKPISDKMFYDSLAKNLELPLLNFQPNGNYIFPF